MDPFEDALDDLRISGSVLLHETYSGQWAIDVPDERQMHVLLNVSRDMRIIPFHLVRRGGFMLSSGQASIALGAEDMSLVTGGQAHRLSVGTGARAVKLADILEGSSPLPGVSCPDQGVTELICGAFFARATPLNPLLGALPAMIKIWAGGQRSESALSGVVSLLSDELGRRPGNNFTTQRLLEILCAEAVRASQRGESASAAGWFQGLADPKIYASLRQIHAKPAHPWCLQLLASEAALSPSRFAARFREKMGESAMGYVARWRANVACRLLRSTELSLAEIAGRVGYESASAFSRAFTALVGTTPHRWRTTPASSAP